MARTTLWAKFDLSSLYGRVISKGSFDVALFMWVDAKSVKQVHILQVAIRIKMAIVSLTNLIESLFASTDFNKVF